jgi:hypothetical protein
VCALSSPLLISSCTSNTATKTPLPATPIDCGSFVSEPNQETILNYLNINVQGFENDRINGLTVIFPQTRNGTATLNSNNSPYFIGTTNLTYSLNSTKYDLSQLQTIMSNSYNVRYGLKNESGTTTKYQFYVKDSLTKTDNPAMRVANFVLQNQIPNYQSSNQISVSNYVAPNYLTGDGGSLTIMAAPNSTTFTGAANINFTTNFIPTVPSVATDTLFNQYLDFSYKVSSVYKTTNDA